MSNDSNKHHKTNQKPCFIGGHVTSNNFITCLPIIQWLFKMQVTPGDLKNTLELCFKKIKPYVVVAWPLFKNPSSITSDYFYLHICMYFFQVMLLMCGVKFFVWSKIFSCFYTPFLYSFLLIQE